MAEKLRVAVTGASGYVGGRLISELESDPNVAAVLALDIMPPPRTRSDKVRFVRVDVTQPFPNLFAEHGIYTVAHLAYVMDPRRRPSAAWRVNVLGAQRVLEACASARVRHVLYLSSTSVYGARADNPDLLTERHPVRPMTGFQYSEDKAAAESLLTQFARRHTAASVTILRVCPVLGPRADNFIANAFRKPILPLLGNSDPHMQFLHEDDLTEVIARCLEIRPRGIYNVAGDGAIRWSRMAETMGSRALRLPPFAWRALASLGWSLRLQNESPPVGLDFIRYRWIASADKIKRALDIEFRHTSCEAWRSYVEKT